MYIFVINGSIIGMPFNLGKTLNLNDGRTISNPGNLSKLELIDIGVYEVIDTTLINPAYESKGSPIYTINGDIVNVSHTIIKKNLTDYINERIADVYAISQSLINAQSIGRSNAEMSKWEHLKNDIAQYKVDGIINRTLSKSILTSTHDLQSLILYVDAKETYEEDVYESRMNHVIAIKSLTNHADVANYDINSLWPAEI